jgi:uncharacterized protein (DUF488 family)
MQKDLYTVGHSTHSLEYFTELLQRNAIEAICDVRSVPYSRHSPQFNRENLRHALRASSVEYVFLGKQLGARSDNPKCYIDGKVVYNYLVDEPSFQEGLRRVKRGLESYRVALMCAERDPLTCHRTILVCRELRSPDININHILADGRTESNSQAEKRLMSTLGIVPDMFESEQRCVDRAYDLQATRIAYTNADQQSVTEDDRFSNENPDNRLYK